MSAQAVPIEVFCSYADADESLCLELDKHLSQLRRDGLISTWHKRLVVAGADSTKALDLHLNTASIILLLVSADFIASDYCYGIEMQRAMERHEAGEAHVIPILLRPVDWQSAPFGKLQALPSNRRSVTSWANYDEAFAAVAQGIRAVLQKGQRLAVSTHRASFPSTWNIPYPRNSVFTGREEILSQIERQLQKGQVTSQPLAINGLGGIGKTQVAVEYFYQHHRAYQAVFWTLADTRESLVSGYIAIAGLLNLPEKDEQDQTIIIRAVMRWLTTMTSWLLILDNADDLTVVREFVPPVFGGHILLTTQNQKMGRFAKRIELEAMGQDVGALFLLRRAGLLVEKASLDSALPSDVITAREICEELGRLPLALDQAGAYIEEVQCGLLDYQQRYRAHPTRLLKRRGEGGADHPEPVATTWSLSFEKVERRSPIAADLLRSCAFFHPDAIPVEVITQGACHLGPSLAHLAEDDVALDEAIAVLGTYSLIRRDGETKTLSLHRLVQTVLRDIMDEQTKHLWAERAMQAVNNVFPAVSFTTWPQCERYLSHALVCVDWIKQECVESPEAMRLFPRTVYYLLERGHFTEARPLLQQALAMSQRVLSIDKETYGLERPEVATDLHNLANLYKTQGDYAKAVPLFRQALTIRRKAKDLGETHPDTAQCMWCLAFTHWQMSQYDDAVSLYHDAYSIFLLEYELEHLSVQKLRKEYVSLLKELGRNEEADFLETFGHLPS